jgi:anaerobic selenocysteine-containing dehydrogenase
MPHVSSHANNGLFSPERAEDGTVDSSKTEARPGDDLGRLFVLSTMRSHDQWNTTIYSDNDRYRDVKNLRTLLFMNREDMNERGLADFDLIDITSHARDGSTRSVYGYRVIAYDIPQGSVAGYMPELNVLCALDDYSRQSDQPLMKHQLVTIASYQGR